MGNRAVVTFASADEIAKYIKGEAIEGAKNLEGFVEANPNRVGVYLHWNGGYNSIKPFWLASGWASVARSRIAEAFKE